MFVQRKYGDERGRRGSAVHRSSTSSFAAQIVKCTNCPIVQVAATVRVDEIWQPPTRMCCAQNSGCKRDDRYRIKMVIIYTFVTCDLARRKQCCESTSALWPMYAALVCSEDHSLGIALYLKGHT